MAEATLEVLEDEEQEFSPSEVMVFLDPYPNGFMVRVHTANEDGSKVRKLNVAKFPIDKEADAREMADGLAWLFGQGYEETPLDTTSTIAWP